LLQVGCGLSLPGKPNKDEEPIPPDKVVDFDQLYQQNCAGCHGADGKLGPAPPLNDTLFLSLVPDEELLMTISQGRSVGPGQSTPMPAFAKGSGGPLTNKQVAALASGIKEKWGRSNSPPEDAPPYSEGEEAAAGDPEAGGRVFARACAGCHGPEGKGGEYHGRAVGAINNQAFLALISDQALRRFAITGRPDLDMPPYNESHGRPKSFRPLTATDATNLVALLASWRASAAEEEQ
jgi:mono/diheme cytochrome c family protein